MLTFAFIASTFSFAQDEKPVSELRLITFAQLKILTKKTQL